MLNKILWDLFICMALVSPLYSDFWLLHNLSKMLVVFMFIIIMIASMVALGMCSERSKGKKVHNFKELQKCKNFWRFKVYEPFSDLCIAMSLAAIGHYIMGAIYFMIGSLIRGIKYIELKEYEEEINGSKGY